MLIEVVLVSMAIPTGLLISWMARDELIIGRNWFKIIALISIIMCLYFLIIGNASIGLSLIFSLIVAIISLQKSYDKKWAKKRFK